MNDQRAIGSTLALVAYFHRALGHKHSSFALSEAAYALDLLRDHGFDELKAFVDFGIMEARKSGFKMERLNALKVYVDRWFDQRTTAAERERRERAIVECGYCGGDGY